MIGNLIGYVLCILLAVYIGINKSESKQKYFNDMKSGYKYIVFGILLQIIVTLILLKSQTAINIIKPITNVMMKIKDCAVDGTKFVFGYLGGGDLPFEVKPNSSAFIFAFQALPTVVLVGAISAILNYTKVIHFFSRIVGSVFRYVFNINKYIGTVSVAKIFLGQIEAPLLIKYKLGSLNQFDTLIILSLAFSTSSSSVMPIYADILKNVCPNAINHLIISNIINTISTLLICKILFPHPEDELYNHALNNDIPLSNNIIEPRKSLIKEISDGISSCAGAWWGMIFALVGMVALVSFIDYLLALFPAINGKPLTVQRIIALITYPIVCLFDINKSEIIQVSQILGTRIALNETVAFYDLAKSTLSHESITKIIYAINNFGNFGCIGITINGLMTFAPQQKYFATMANTAFIVGFISTILTTVLVSLFI